MDPVCLWMHFCVLLHYIPKTMHPQIYIHLVVQLFLWPLMSFIFKSIGVFATAVGSSIICTESIIFNNINYINPIYNTLKLIGSILPSIQSSPRPIYGGTKSANGRGRHKSSGRHLYRYFACKQRESKQAVISPDTIYNDSTKKNPSSDYSSQVQVPGSKSSLAPSTTSDYSLPGPKSSIVPSTTYDYSSPFQSIYHTVTNATSYVLTHQVIPNDDTVSVSVLPPHAKPIIQPKHKEVRSVGDNVGANTSITLDSASSIHLFKDRSLLSNINGFQAIVPLTGQEKGVLFLRGCISLKNWSYRPLLRASTSPFKSTCLLIKLK
jgi:hypothetical protein